MFRDMATFLAHAGQVDEAREPLGRFVASRPRTTLREVSDSLGFMEAGLRGRYVEGLRLAGLSE